MVDGFYLLIRLVVVSGSPDTGDWRPGRVRLAPRSQRAAPVADIAVVAEEAPGRARGSTHSAIAAAASPRAWIVELAAAGDLRVLAPQTPGDGLVYKGAHPCLAPRAAAVTAGTVVLGCRSSSIS